MGLLDDAIREHLELKRKHGANPEDVARQEKEALGQGGPRAEFAQPGGEPEAPAPEAPAEPAPAAAETTAPEFDVPEFQPAAEPPAPPEPEPEPEPEPAADELPQGDPGITEIPTQDHPAAAPGYDEDPWLDDEPDEVPAEESLQTPREEPKPTGEEDVLEETPDFLQETPEHDRLWFEQKPPRDFDWDK
jgi:hypothetical protein